MQTHGQCPWHKVPKFPRPPHPPHPPTAHRPLPARQLNMVQMEKRRIIPNGPCLFETVMAGDPPPETSTTPPPPSLARPESDQSRCSLAGCHGTRHVQRVLSRCQKKGRPGCHPTTCMRASFPDVPRPQVAVLEMASRCGDFRGVSGKSKSIVETSRTAEHVYVGS